MKKNKWTLKAGTILLSAAFIACMTGFFSGCSNNDAGNKSAGTSSGEIINDNADLDDFDKADIEVDAGNVQIVKGTKYAIESEYNNEIDKLTYEVNDGKLIVKAKRIGNKVDFFDFGNKKSMELKIYVPDDKIDELNMEIGSGDLKIDSISGKSLELQCGSGSVVINDSSYDKINAETGSGNLTTDNLTSKVMQIENGSGNVTCSTLKTDMLSIKSGSGNVDLDGELKGKNNIEIASGNINIKTSLNKKDYSYDISNISGTISIDGESKKKEYKEENGDGANLFNVECSSGDINIKF